MAVDPTREILRVGLFRLILSRPRANVIEHLSFDHSISEPIQFTVPVSDYAKSRFSFNIA